MADHPNVRRFLDLSTVHLSLDTREAWALTTKPSWVHPTEYGFFVWAGTAESDAPDDDAEYVPPAEVVACRKLARSLGCDYLLFDADADTVEGLEVFDDDAA